MDACLGCPEGTFSVTVGATSKEDCKKCPVGTFNNNIGGSINNLSFRRM